MAKGNPSKAWTITKQNIGLLKDQESIALATNILAGVEALKPLSKRLTSMLRRDGHLPHNREISVTIYYDKLTIRAVDSITAIDLGEQNGRGASPSPFDLT